MKKLYTLIIASLLLTAGNSFSQTFTFSQVDYSAIGNPGDELIFKATLMNLTSSNISMRVTRQKNVDVDAPTWTSAFCMDVCYLPSTDSVNYTFLPMDTVDFTFHMYTSSTADDAIGKMRWKNVTTPSNTFNADFCGATNGTTCAGAGINSYAENSANVSIYPMPVSSGEMFAMNVSNVKSSGAITMVVYNTLGSVVLTKNVIAGINLMDTNLSGGVYSYSLISGNSVINSGKLVVTE